jgi:hypothetical protein
LIERQNILELFGADSKKYHSCIITCFSFDFLFFEQRVLSKLRQAGMININVFVDAAMFEQQLENLTGQEYHNKKSYSIIPVKMNGAFHPKIIFAIGKKNGFLAIGSGNLTNSGLSSNDEIWGAAHTFNIEGKAIGIFKEIYPYLENLSLLTNGINSKKFDWIIAESPWLKELLSSKNDFSFIPYKANGELRVLKSFGDNSIYKKLISLLPNAPKKITIISPFFNSKGQVISSLINDLNPEKVDVVLDPVFGTVPYQFTSDKQVDFYLWEDVKEESAGKVRLHAKLIQFEYESFTFLLFGSPNATQEALGTYTSNSKNAEVALLIKSNDCENWIEELKIQIPFTGNYQLSNYEPKLKNQREQKSKSFPVFINHVELDHETLFIYFQNRKNERIGKLNILDRKLNKRLIPFFMIRENLLEIALEQKIAEDCFMVYFINDKKERISNFGLCHSTQLLNNTNPDIKRARFLELLNSNDFSDNYLTELLEYVPLKKKPGINKYHSGSSNKNTDVKSEIQKNYESVSEDEFNRNQSNLQKNIHGQYSHLSQLEDVLNKNIFNSTPEYHEDFADSVERSAEIEKDKGLKSESIKKEQLRLSFTDGLTLRKAIHNTLIRIGKFIGNQQDSLLNNLSQNSNSIQLILFDEIHAVLIGSYLIFLKLTEHFTEERLKLVVGYTNNKDLGYIQNEENLNLQLTERQPGKKDFKITYTMDVSGMEQLKEMISNNKLLSISYIDETPSIMVWHPFFNFEPIIENNKPVYCSVKGFLINSYCPFLHLMYNQFVTYEGQERLRFEMYKKRLFYRIILLSLLSHWKTSEKDLFKLMLLNTFHLLIPSITESNEIIIELDSLLEKIKYPDQAYEKNKYVLVEYFDSFLKWKKQYSNNKEELIKNISKDKIGQIIFDKRFGFAMISSILKKNLNLISPLGKYYTNEKIIGFHNVISGSKRIFYI